MRGKQDGGSALGGIEHERRRGERFGARAQYIGCPDVARADLAHVAEPGQLRQDQAERDRPEQIAETACREINSGATPIGGRSHRSPLKAHHVTAAG
jgi:hypothetical protein